MLLRLTMVLVRPCIGPERALIMLQKREEGKSYKEDSGNNVKFELKVSPHPPNFSIA